MSQPRFIISGQKPSSLRTRRTSRTGRVVLSLTTLWLLGAPAVIASDVGKADIELKECGPPERETEMHCGTLEVLENPDQPEGRSVHLPVVVLPAIDGNSGRQALFQLEGGPGIAVSGIAPFYLDDGREFRRGRDVVLLDQRGTGEPSPLRCTGLEKLHPLDDVYPLEPVKACRQELEPTADLTKYSTWLAAGDIDRAREALGYATIDIWAISYGTKLAQTYMKRFPTRVRTAFFVGTVPPDLRAPLLHATNAQRVLDLLFFQCQSDPACREAYPALRHDWQGVLARLAEGPVHASHRDPETGDETTVEIRRGPFGEAFRELLSTTTGQRRIPHLIQRAASGDFSAFLEALPPDRSMFVEGLYLSVTCPEGTSRIDPTEIGPTTAGTFLGDYRVRQQRDACSAWRSAPVPDDFFEPTTADVPVLIISGTMDHVAPPEWSHRVCDQLPRCRLVSVPDLGHVPFDLAGWEGGDCFDRLALELFRTGSTETVDVSCLEAMTPPSFHVE